MQPPAHHLSVAVAAAVPGQLHSTSTVSVSTCKGTSIRATSLLLAGHAFSGVATLCAEALGRAHAAVDLRPRPLWDQDGRR